MKVYMQVTKDKYELPLVIADSPSELARMTGRGKNNVLSTIAHGKTGKIKKPSFISVEIEGIKEPMKKIPVTKKCEWCGKEFEAADNRRRFCSKSCSITSRNMRMSAQKAGLAEPRNGYYRPTSCFKCCIYNTNGGCHYQQDKELSKPIVRWQACPYYDDGDTFKYERAQTPVSLDRIYGHIAAFKDSHSAVWMY